MTISFSSVFFYLYSVELKYTDQKQQMRTIIPVQVCKINSYISNTLNSLYAFQHLFFEWKCLDKFFSSFRLSVK